MDNSQIILDQFTKFSSILSKVVDQESVDALIDIYGDRLVLCPRGLKADEGGQPGELVKFSLSVASLAKELGTQHGLAKSLVKVSLLHEIGKLGDPDNELYIPQDSDWHRDKLNQNYKYNDACSKMGINHRTMWIINKLKIDLTIDEYIAIQTSQGFHLNENQFYGQENYKNKLVSLFQSARNITLATQD
jgi:hypothetical protein